MSVRRGGLRRQLGLLSSHRWWVVAGVLLGFLAIGSSVGLMAVSAWLISRAALASSVSDVALAITAVRVLAISRAAFRYLERIVTHRATFRILSNLRVWFFGAIEPLAPARLEGHRSGDILTRIVADVDSLEDLFPRVVLPPLVAALVTAVASLALGVLDPMLGVALALFLVLTGVVLPLTLRWLGGRPSREAIATRAELHASLVDQVRGVADLVAFDQATTHRDALLTLGARLDGVGERLALVRGVGTALGALVATLAGVTLLGIAIPLVTDGRLDGLMLAVVPLAAIACFEAVQPLTQSLQLLDSTDAASRRLFELTDAPPAVRDPERPAAAPTDHGITVRDLAFRYAPDLPDAVRGLDLSIPAGGSLALVGSSGSGKSTLVELLLRFREHDRGSIRIGGREIAECAQDEVRALIAVVPQRIHLFDATVRDNLAVARADASDEQMEAACRIACIHDVISALPHGYASRIGEDGVRLSGGERQRLAIARAILKDAPILILDEATANLDSTTERDVMDGLLAWARGRTVLLITHREELARRADAVVAIHAPT